MSRIGVQKGKGNFAGQKALVARWAMTMELFSEKSKADSRIAKRFHEVRKWLPIQLFEIGEL